MKIPDVEDLRKEHERITRLLAQSVARKFPVGAPVWVKWGPGKMLARVAAGPCEWTDPTVLSVISANGRQFHHRDYRDCTLIG